jgi:hypothetical protein
MNITIMHSLVLSDVIGELHEFVYNNKYIIQNILITQDDMIWVAYVYYYEQ